MTDKKPAAASLLAINGGSSSIKFALYSADSLVRSLHGNLERIGSNPATLTFNDEVRGERGDQSIPAPDHASAAALLIDWLESREQFGGVRAAGHRVVYGLKFTEPVLVTQEFLDGLRRAIPYDPDHLPLEIVLMEELRRRSPSLPQIACFDTAFHRTMPRVAQILPIPRHFASAGIQRYGFHGLSYGYLAEELERTAGIQAGRGRVILAHLGNGASMAALRDGKSLDTSMGFTPAGGLPMGTRSGDLDPGVAWHFMRNGVAAEEFGRIVNHGSGLLGISETSSDMRDLLELQARDVRAAEAVEFFCYQSRKCIGAFAAALGGLDTIVFSGGIGENAPEVRSRICDGLGFLGVTLDEVRNRANAALISSDASSVAVRMIRTNEELMIARAACRLFQMEEKPR